MTNILYIFRGTKIETIKLIADYLRSKHQNCFTYKGLRGFYDKTRSYRRLEWHTVERNIRELAQYGWLVRNEKRRKEGRHWVRHVWFCLTDNLRYELEKLGWI